MKVQAIKVDKNYQLITSIEELKQIYNCGIGYVIICDKNIYNTNIDKLNYKKIGYLKIK